MGLRVAAIIALCTFFSYLHMFNSLRAEALVRLEGYVSERSQREQAIFVLAEDNQLLLRKALKERLQVLGQEDPSARFDSLFMRMPDGTIRDRPERFDGTKMPCVFFPKGVHPDAEQRRVLLASYDVLSQYGPAFLVRFKNTYISFPSGAFVVFWPERPAFCQDAEATFSVLPFELFTLSTPEHNAQRRPVWTGIFVEPTSALWMVSVSTPLDMDGRHVTTISHDILLEELMDRTIHHHLPGAYNVLFRDDGQVIAHPKLILGKATEGYNILGPPGQGGDSTPKFSSVEEQVHLRNIFDRVKNRAPGEIVQEIPEQGEYAAVSRLKGPEWNFVTVLPEREVSSAAFQAARYVLLFGVVSLILELVIMYWVLRQQITRPLLNLTQATGTVAVGNFKVQVDTSRKDELGQLAQGFQLMAGEVQRREEALKQANEGLELRVEQRTLELKELHRKLLDTAREVGRAEIATNVLHNVGNVLNSVNTAALLAQQRLAELKLDSVNRVVSLCEEHQADLATFLTQDERGRNVLPFLRWLGKYMREEVQELHTLLGDVSRHTEHIGAIVKMQQRYARTSQLFEPVDLRDLVEDALRINLAALSRHAVKVERSLEPLPPVLTEKHKVLMILVNLISNAKYALEAVPQDERRMSLKLARSSAEHLRIEIQDNGVGIAPEMHTRIFQYGFTTRQEGHGFGLHSSALAAQELGGSLSVHSEGVGQGATFILELPAAYPQSEPSHGEETDLGD
ncbi:ATP-binding protein [Stigmatella sp. ncwal1]|uniref:histidine kinase n=1 Tax=Stigmatella ashevillensis TaxID=2995309 RepID=A0ABT5DDI7_9BACT|nr:ATP-binding protein [Stigmatella ashevillena]MDC0710838.1 ATP-binding protein [Stigmatella ashevillena]